jgi:hypothetical protein
MYTRIKLIFTNYDIINNEQKIHTQCVTQLEQCFDSKDLHFS